MSAVQKYNIFNATPRLLIETVCMAGLILYLIFMILSGEDVTSMVSQLGAFGVAAMRLLPSANRINNYLTQISYFEPFFMGVSDNLQEEINDKNVVYDEAAYRRNKPVDKLPLQDKIVLDDIVYKYPNSEVLIFDHAHMEIPAGKSVGIVGTSGAGKTTIVDIMLGLLSIQEGHILADGVEVRDHYESWLKNIGYIPQTIFMIDSTIRKMWHSVTRMKTSTMQRSGRHSKKPVWMSLSAAFPKDWIPALASVASGFPAVSVRESELRERCLKIRRFWFWMKRPAHWITIQRLRSWNPSTACMVIRH